MPKKREEVVVKNRENQENMPVAGNEKGEEEQHDINMEGNPNDVTQDQLKNSNKRRKTNGRKNRERRDDVVECTSESDHSRDTSMAVVSTHSTDHCNAIRKMPFVASNWPKVINKHQNRRFFEFTQQKRKLGFGEAKFNSEATDHCLFCGVKDSKLLKCGGHINGLINAGKQKLPCESKFHLDCAMNYNASDYYLPYIVQRECQNDILCPLHFCDTCFLERRKQTAFIGKLFECAICLRSFHYNKCTPIGCKDLELTLERNQRKYQIEMVICPAHRPLKDIKRAHLPCCCECETDQPEVPLVNCRTCIRSFHAKCRTAETIDGNLVPADVCEFCVTEECLRIDTPVIAKWTDNKFYPAFTREWRMCPMNLRKNRHYDKLGYCLVEWKGMASDAFSVIAISDCAPVSESSIKFLKSKIKSPYQNAWHDLMNHPEFQPSEPLYKEVGKKLDTAKYSSKGAERANTEQEIWICACSLTDVNHCNTDKCNNRKQSFECPPDCNTTKSICHNRDISDKKVNSKCERRKTDNKGFGLFANGFIKSGEFISEYAGEIIDRQEVERRSSLIANARDNEASLFMMSLSHGRAVDATRFGNIARYINHSCEPNCEAMKKLVLIKQRRNDAIYDTRIAIVAIKDIANGEELTLKYNMDDVQRQNTVAPKCKCGAGTCAGYLGGSGRIRSEEIRHGRHVMKKMKKETSETKKEKKKAVEEVKEQQPKRQGEEDVKEENPRRGKKRRHASDDDQIDEEPK